MMMTMTSDPDAVGLSSERLGRIGLAIEKQTPLEEVQASNTHLADALDSCLPVAHQRLEDEGHRGLQCLTGEGHLLLEGQ